LKASGSKHKALLPLITYLEAVTKESDPSSLEAYPVRYQIASDIAKLTSLNEKLSCFYQSIEEQLKDGQVLEVIKKEKALSEEYAQIDTWKYLAELSEDTLWESYGAALMNNTTKLQFKEFTQE